jgi:hypothetical protein
LVSLKETLEVAKINAEEMVTKVPFWDRIVNYHTERQNTSHALLEPDSGQDLDETYVPHSEDE